MSTFPAEKHHKLERGDGGQAMWVGGWNWLVGLVGTERASKDDWSSEIKLVARLGLEGAVR